MCWTMIFLIYSNGELFMFQIKGLICGLRVLDGANYCISQIHIFLYTTRMGQYPRVILSVYPRRYYPILVHVCCIALLHGQRDIYSVMLQVNRWYK